MLKFQRFVVSIDSIDSSVFSWFFRYFELRLKTDLSLGKGSKSIPTSDTLSVSPSHLKICLMCSMKINDRWPLIGVAFRRIDFVKDTKFIA